MIIKNFPIDTRHLLQMLMCSLKFYFRTRKIKAGSGMINFLYFSYAPDFEFLCLSINSLTKNIDPELLGRIFVAEDQKAPFSSNQIAQLATLYSNIEVLPIHDFSWGSAASTFEEGQLFLKVCCKIPSERDMIAKIDSDVLIFDDTKLKRICYSSVHAAGDPHFLQYKFSQGGLYLLRKSFVEDIIPKITLEDIERANQANDSVGEDKAFSYLFNRFKRPFIFTRLMLFPDEYKGITKITRWVRKDFCALHFHKDKDKMGHYGSKLEIL